MHYAFGAALGIAYGMLAEAEPRVTMGAGAAFGTAVVLIADDLAVPAFGWGKWPAQASLRTHAYGLASHLVFGFITEATRRVVRGALRGTWWALLGSNQRPTD